jgi:copper ion binding protein
MNLKSNPQTSHATDAAVTTVRLQVTGMTCDHCVRAVSGEIGAIPGVRDVDVDLPSGRVVVVSDGPVDRDDLAAAVDEAGYELAS